MEELGRGLGKGREEERARGEREAGPPWPMRVKEREMESWAGPRGWAALSFLSLLSFPLFQTQSIHPNII
jgi:NhaP-type Na+/H+ or K+/H+ antiporter